MVCEILFSNLYLDLIEFEINLNIPVVILVSNAQALGGIPFAF
jgi:hypothetical protein